MNEFTHYNIPLRLLPAYRRERLVVRTDEPAALASALEAEDPERIVGAQIVALDTDSEPLNAWAPGLPLELILRDPVAEFPLLYRHTNLLDNHPARVIVPVAPGFGKAVKVAVSLDFAVRLEVEQPEPALIEEMAAVLEFYLHQPTVAQPIEYFHGSLRGFFHDEPASLWVLQDDDPQYLRYVTDEGVERLSRRLVDPNANIAPDADLGEWIAQVLAVDEECQGCAFLNGCGGYFKWPRRDYDCAGVKRLFGHLRDAAAELRRDLDVGSA
ncbi:MAG: hypothetical protein P9E24_07370 [Candidatus Competibacter sp.]|nr:hypothetical protein [Candidatus Competibacter sp.]MDG4584764.1 hypothetical protein [Candidatus Competibacter sp.]